ncbi:MAG: LysR family transcriptional regulator [Lachnospiraceae bacterium]|nr:LysR family transcriptional regulator [Lachnospiraceae bacterium]
MELLQLRYFYESAQTENFSHTAAKYLVSPSSVSISIKKLESELGCELFDRDGNKIHLNSNGRLLQKALSVSLPVLDEAVEVLSSTESEQVGDIRLLVRSERRNILDYIYRFKQTHPNIIFRISHDFNATDISPYDFIIDEQTSRYGGFACLPMIKESIRLAASGQNPLTGKQLLLHDLKDEPFITMCNGSSLNRITVESCRKAGFTPNIVIESDDPQYIRNCIEMDLGIAFVPEISWQGELGKNTHFLEVADFELTRITCIYRNQAKALSPAAMAFYRGISEAFQL